MSALTRALTAATLTAAGLTGYLLPLDVPWMPPSTPLPASDVQVEQTHSPLTPGRWSAREDGWLAYQDYYGENNGCRNDFELSYSGLVKAGKVTKAQRDESEVVPVHDSRGLKGYVHLIESTQQEDGAC